ncbi:class I SAM-dependent methyltransferase [Candidatus Methanocrinis natronophilus]|uniref:Class I SAM-dependent methyltransferase family protein n=1 Tax=Candidatus Methanocrinis natronophilus TaxID=3033396 RepID=A0ABT5XA44_9EURY|nr:class I SAM-dependent methyltransferase family protein [Candidatus Methanocrinis natronophilus]MDF0591586.1 class I SAM-dependent methyltransferase family protein [Candidatus Methanocrinis natronophilus]
MKGGRTIDREERAGGTVLRDAPFTRKPPSITPGEGRDRIPGRFSLIGDVAVLSIPPSFEGDKRGIGEAIKRSHRNVRTVLNKVSKLEGDRRVASFDLLAGEGTVTSHREYGFSYKLDVAQVFYNPRLGSERMRVASRVTPGERAIVPFAGVGPFAIPLAAAGARVLAMEINPEACRWMAENAGLNGVGGMVEVVNADAFALCRAMAKRSPADACEGTLEEKMGRGEKGKATEKKEKRQGRGFDRAVVPTPYGRDEILDTIIPLVRPGGSITFYTFKKRSEIEGLIREFEGLGLAVELHRRCGNVAPGVSRWAFDMVKL